MIPSDSASSGRYDLKAALTPDKFIIERLHIKGAKNFYANLWGSFDFYTDSL
jgi:hypothetical protein